MSQRVGVVWDPCFLGHDVGADHPEQPSRLQSIREVLEEKGTWAHLHLVQARPATQEELIRNHSAAHVAKVLAADGVAHTAFDDDTYASAGTTKAALYAAGGAIDLAKAVWCGDIDKGFSLARPPGHHAERDTPMGFCYFNHVALAARALLEEEQLSRILIVDWDVHHGNGTQHSFEDDPRVLYFSMHQYPFYPGTGAQWEMGINDGRGYTVNIPIPSASGDDDYIHYVNHALRPIAAQYAPEIILLSAGYDAHHLDPLGEMEVTTAGFAQLTQILCDIAQETCQGKLVSILEGGYHLAALSESVNATLEVMLGKEVPSTTNPDAVTAHAHLAMKCLAGQFKGVWSFGD